MDGRRNVLKAVPDASMRRERSRAVCSHAAPVIPVIPDTHTTTRRPLITTGRQMARCVYQFYKFNRQLKILFKIKCLHKNRGD